jgi:hypothetical protein
MIGVLVRFRYGNEFSEARVRQVAEAARGRFVGLPGLRSKAFTVDPQKREALNFYIWETEEAARVFFTPELTARVTGLYGVAPTLEFVSVAALVENPSA